MTTTKTAVPTTAREAQQLAERLAQKERDTAARRRDADNAARLAEAHKQLAHADEQLAPERQRAVSALNAAITDPDVSLSEVTDLYLAARIASAVRVAAVATASAVLDQYEPRRSPVSGQPIQHRNDVYDPLALASLADTLEQAARERISHAVNASIDRINQATAAAGQHAADQAAA